VRKADNLTAICEPIVKKMWKPRRLTTYGLPRPVTGTALPVCFEGLHIPLKFSSVLGSVSLVILSIQKVFQVPSVFAYAFNYCVSQLFQLILFMTLTLIVPTFASKQHSSQSAYAIKVSSASFLILANS
jgi:hypothetical protein